MDLNEILVFTRVVQSGSFSAAARLLGLPKSTVSRKVSALEGRIGARLIQRTTRKLGLTDAGRVYFEHTSRVVTEIEEGEQAVNQMQAKPRGLLRVTAPLSFELLGGVVGEYLAKYPEVRVSLTCTDRQVDLVEEGFDVAIRAGQLADSTLIARSLGIIKRVLVASPGYCKEHGTPRGPADLSKHDCISFAAGPNPNVWLLFNEGKKTEVRISPRLTANDLDVLCAAARAAVGIAWIPEFVCAEDLSKGRLRRVLPDWGSAQTPIHAVYPTTRHLSPKTTAFVELARQRFSGSWAGPRSP